MAEASNEQQAQSTATQSTATTQTTEPAQSTAPRTLDPWTLSRPKVAIVGFATHWVDCNFEDPTQEIWCLNEFYDVAPEQLKKPLAEGRVRWFEIHGREGEYDGNPFVHSRKPNEHAPKMAALGVPVYMQKHWDDIPLSVEYPLKEMQEAFSHQPGSPAYFTNSISYMMALALHMGAKEMRIYGVDMAQGTEYSNQRPSCEYYIGWAKAKGVRLYIPPASDLLKYSYLYGWEQQRHDALQTKTVARKAELANRRAALAQQVAQAQAHIHMLDGALENTEYFLGVWLDTAKPKGGA